MTDAGTDEELKSFIDKVVRRNVLRVTEQLCKQSGTLSRLAQDGRIAIVGATYDVVNGGIEFFDEAKTFT